jgi:hypothetical protein
MQQESLVAHSEQSSQLVPEANGRNAQFLEQLREGV